MTQSEGEEARMTDLSPGVAEAPHEFEFDFDTYVAMSDAGLFRPVQGRVQLLEGKLIEMPSARAAHGEVVSRFAALIIPKLRAPHRLITHATLRIDKRSAPDPDAFIVSRSAVGDYFHASDATLVFESGYSSIDLDLKTKARVYARGGIAEYWVADVDGRELHVFRGPQGESWTEHDVLGVDRTVSPLFAPEIVIPVKDLF